MRSVLRSPMIIRSSFIAKLIGIRGLKLIIENCNLLHASEFILPTFPLNSWHSVEPFLGKVRATDRHIMSTNLKNGDK